MARTNVMDMIGKAVALAAFLFTVATYAYNLYIDRKQERYQQAVALIEQYMDVGVRESENELVTRLLYYSDDGVDLNDPETFSDELFENVARETLFGYIGGDGHNITKIKPFLREFLDIMDFYARVDFCVDATICDATIISRYFCPRAQSFADRYRRLIAYYQYYSASEEWRDGLDRFTARCNNVVR